ncbi:MAG: MFS transporter [Deltaproteobacteria bacterium]|nr:MFS transporter [Deltaproteobacteria bacterium]
MLKRFNGLFYGWRMVAASAALRVLGAGLHSFGFTIFFLPLSQDLNLSRTATSFAFSLARAEGAIEGPIVGHVLDRYGPRPVMLTAVLLMGVGYLLLSTVESYAMFLVVYIGVISLAHSGGFMHAPMVLTNSWFIRKRARAITVNSASFSLGGVLIAPVLSAIVLSWGWRWGAAFAGVMFLLIGVPLSSTIRRSPESMGLLPDGDIPSASAEDQKNEPQRRAPAEVDVTTGEAFRSFTFWTLVLGNAIRNMSYHAIATHFVPLMVWKGMSQPQAAFLLSSFAFLGMTTTLLLGWFADRVNKPRLVAGILFVAAGGMLLPVFGSSMWLLLLFTLLFTAVESTYAIGWAVVGDFFGAGAIYDRWQSYEPMLWALVLLFALSGAIFGMLIKRWEKLRAQMTPRIDNDV